MIKERCVKHLKKFAGHDIEKSEDLDRQEYEIRRKHDKEMLIDELERRVIRLEERLNSLETDFNMHQEGIIE